MLGLYTRGKSRVSDAPSFGVRRFQKKKITAAEVQEALEKKKKQKKTFLESYYAKWGKKDAKVVEQEEERDNVQAQSGQKTKSLRQKMRIPDEKYANMLSSWAMKKLKGLHEKNADATEVVMSSAAKQKARDLHNQEPHYWTPNRLGHFFKCSIEKMRGILYEGKLLAEYRKRGLPVDEEDLKIDDQFGEIFGAVDFPNTYDDTPEEIPIRKIHNPWYYVDPGVKSGNLLRFLRRRETRHYKEASRIPAMQFPKHQVFPEVLGKDATGKRIAQKPTPPHKIAKMVMYDSAVRYHLYDRPILIRDHDNTWRTATWEERRRVENGKRQIKYPFHQPFLPDDDSQLDWVAVKDKPPRGFDVGFGTEDYFDDMLSSGKLDKDTRQFLREEENLVPPPNFEKVMKNIARMTSKVTDAVPTDDELGDGEDDGFDNLDGIAQDDYTSASQQRIRRKNDQFTRNLLNYRVRYQVE